MLGGGVYASAGPRSKSIGSPNVSIQGPVVGQNSMGSAERERKGEKEREICLPSSGGLHFL